MKKLTDAQFRTVLRRYKDAVESAIKWGWAWPANPSLTHKRLGEDEPRKLTAYQAGYLDALRDMAWEDRERELVWCIPDADGSVVGTYSALSEEGKRAIQAKRPPEPMGFFVWRQTFKPVVEET